MPGRTSWRSAWLPFALWLAVVFGLSSIPDLSPPEVGVPMTDKLAHLGEYGLLGALWERARSGSRSAGRAVVSGALLGLGVGMVDEVYQTRTPGRESSPLDATADTAGAALGALGWRLRVARRARGESGPGPGVSR